MNAPSPKIAAFLDETIRLLKSLDQSAIQMAESILLDCHSRRGRVYTMGNGGSPSTAQHFGFDGGILHKEATCSILVPVDSTPQTEAIHLVIEHLLMSLLKDELAKMPSPAPR